VPRGEYARCQCRRRLLLDTLRSQEYPHRPSIVFQLAPHIRVPAPFIVLSAMYLSAHLLALGPSALLSLPAAAYSLSTQASLAAPPLSPAHLLLTFAALALLAAAAKASRLVSQNAFALVDRLALSAAGVVVLVDFCQHTARAAATGALSWVKFGQYFAAGGICAFITHAACTPIDVVKTRIQTQTGVKYVGLADGMRRIIAEEGPGALLKGLSATAGGYFLHGAFKYSFYEVFKVLLAKDAMAALKPPVSIAAMAGLLAECIACVLLCPMEAVRIRSVSDSSFPSGAVEGLKLITGSEGFDGLYRGLPAMLLKQVPYTVGQFVSFEFAVVSVRASVLAFLGFPASPDPSIIAFISTSAGLLAGVMAAVISHPGDTILSRVNTDAAPSEFTGGGGGAQIYRIIRSTGFLGLFSGLSVRIIQVACMVGGQFLIYDTIKLWCGIIPASAMGAAVATSLGAGAGAGVGAIAAEAEPVAVTGAARIANVDLRLRPSAGEVRVRG
jgi:solute carrier family 25 (mitochondrial phosphate transporter), member 3